MKQLTEKQRKERKFLLALPILTLPFLCLAFWAMGGGTGGNTGMEELKQGLNMTLPEAQIDSYSLNKLESYEQAEKKESQLQVQRRMDPFTDSSTKKLDSEYPLKIGERSLQETEKGVQEKLSSLERLVNQPERVQQAAGGQLSPVESTLRMQAKAIDDPDLRRLEAMMASFSEPGMEDPEMEQIDSMLDKLLDVQHPQRVHERLLQAKQKAPVYTVNSERGAYEPEYSEELSYPQKERNGFYSLEMEKEQSFATIRPVISAKVTTDQQVVSGASIELELTQAVFIQGMEFPIGTKVTGVCSLNGERLNINVARIRSENLIIPVDLQAVDLDALTGIKIPNAITRDAVKQGAGDGIQSLNAMGMSTSWEAQASMAGMETVKGILSNKAKLVKVSVKAGHPLLLVDLSMN